MTTVLDRIIEAKREHVANCKAKRSLATLTEEARATGSPRGFEAALRTKIAAGNPGIIAEIKRASPSKGVIRKDYQPSEHARSYQSAGAACLSVLTDEPFFQGTDSHLQAVRNAVELPIIRKDFMIDPYQIVEARVLGADCILLIVAALDDALLADLYACAKEQSLDVLVEVHDAEELERALQLEPTLLGVNNRNLKTFETNIENSLELRARVPEQVLLVTESGIADVSVVDRLRAAGINAFLVGEAFMRAPDPGAALRSMFF